MLLFPAVLWAQFFANPSFEGPVGIDTLPSPWDRFDPRATPDTEPLDCDDFTASDGDTYVTLVMHGSGSPQTGVNENIITELLQPLEAGVCYSLSVDLASRDDLGHYEWGIGFIYYREEVILEIYGSKSSPVKGELLAESGIIYNSSWDTHSFTIKPTEDISFLILEVSALGNPPDNGNLLVDNLQIGDLLEQRVMLNDTIETTDLPYVLTATESSSYSWSPETGLSCYDCRSPEVNSSTSQTYTCRIDDPETGCPLDELFQLTIINVVDPPPVLPDDFKIPNVFTPNGDQINDLFEIRELPPNSALLIYDRSGREVFSTENYENNWGGMDSNGALLPEGNYWYVLIPAGLEERQKGYVYIKRN